MNITISDVFEHYADVLSYAMMIGEETITLNEFCKEVKEASYVLASILDKMMEYRLVGKKPCKKRGATDYESCGIAFKKESDEGLGTCVTLKLARALLNKLKPLTVEAVDRYVIKEKPEDGRYVAISERIPLGAVAEWVRVQKESRYRRTLVIIPQMNTAYLGEPLCEFSRHNIKDVYYYEGKYRSSVEPLKCVQGEPRAPITIRSVEWLRKLKDDELKVKLESYRSLALMITTKRDTKFIQKRIFSHTTFSASESVLLLSTLSYIGNLGGFEGLSVTKLGKEGVVLQTELSPSNVLKALEGALEEEGLSFSLRKSGNAYVIVDREDELH